MSQGTAELSTASNSSKFSILSAAFNYTSPPPRGADGNISEEERLAVLERLQAETTIVMIPALIFLILLAVTGLFGNCMVLFVYSRRFTRTSTRVYVLVIAALDIVANVIGIPGEIYDMFHIWDFYNGDLCRARLFFNSFSTLSSAMVLLAVAVTRYRKVCVPYGWQTTVRQARIISVVLVCLGILFSIPYVVISGRQSKKTDRAGVTGFECTVADDYEGTVWPLLNNAFFLVLFFATAIPLIVIYIRIGIQAWKHSAVHGSTSTATGNRSLPVNSSSMDQQEVFSQCSVKSKKSTKWRKSKAAPSTGSEDVSSAAGELSETSFHRTGSSDKYIVRILEDSVEITTPMMGQFIVQLKQASELGEVETLGNGDIGSVRSKKIENPRLAFEAVADSSKNQLPEKMTHVTGFENISFKNEEDRVASFEQSIDHAKDDHIIQHNDHPGAIHDSSIESSHADKETVQVVSESNSLDKHFPESAESFDSSVNLNRSTSDSHDVVSDPAESPKDTEKREEFHTPDLPHNGITHVNTMTGTSQHEDPTSSLRWVDIVFCPQDQVDAASMRRRPSAPMSFRVSPTNGLLQRTEWLRNLISLALARKKDRKREEIISTDEAVLSVKIPEFFPLETEADDDVFKQPSCAANQSDAYLRKTRKLTGRLRSVLSLRQTWRKFSSRGSGQSRRRPLGRTTAMLIFISAFFVVGFIPYLILNFFKLSAPGSYASMGRTEQSVYNLFLRTYFINCAVNPIIYSFCDNNFRRECIKLLRC